MIGTGPYRLLTMQKQKTYSKIRDAPDIQQDSTAFFISGIRPDTGTSYGKPDFRLLKSRISGQICR